MARPMNCAAVREVLPLYVDEGCEPAMTETIRLHLAACASCAAAADQAIRVRQLLQRQPSLHAPDALWAAIADRVARPAPAPFLRRVVRATWRPKQLAVAAVMILGIGVGYLIGRPAMAPQVASRSLRVVDVSSAPGLEVAFLLGEHGRTGDAPAFSTHMAVFNAESSEK